jgi:hypothetical protein
LWPQQRAFDGHVVFQPMEHAPQHDHAQQDRKRARQSRASDAHGPARAPAGDENRRQDGIDHDGENLHEDRRLHDAGAAQCGPHRHERELQRQARQVPAEVLRTGGCRRGIGAENAHVRRSERVPAK